MNIFKQICNFNKDVNIFKLALKTNFGCETKIMTMKIHQGYSTGDVWGWNEQHRKGSLETGMRNKQKGKSEIKPWQGETSGGKKKSNLKRVAKHHQVNQYIQIKSSKMERHFRERSLFEDTAVKCPKFKGRNACMNIRILLNSTQGEPKYNSTEIHYDSSVKTEDEVRILKAIRDKLPRCKGTKVRFSVCFPVEELQPSSLAVCI